MRTQDCPLFSQARPSRLPDRPGPGRSGRVADRVDSIRGYPQVGEGRQQLRGSKRGGRAERGSTPAVRSDDAWEKAEPASCEPKAVRFLTWRDVVGPRWREPKTVRFLLERSRPLPYPTGLRIGDRFAAALWQQPPVRRRRSSTCRTGLLTASMRLPVTSGRQRQPGSLAGQKRGVSRRRRSGRAANPKLSAF